MTDRDPNEGSTDPMIAEYWLLGEAVQDKLIALGYESETVEGIAVDIHDILQAADRIKEVLAPGIVNGESEDGVRQAVANLKQEMDHLRWHGQNAVSFLSASVD